jgi:hypothetical protein
MSLPALRLHSGMIVNIFFLSVADFVATAIRERQSGRHVKAALNSLSKSGQGC